MAAAFAPHFFEATSREADVLIAASAALRLGPWQFRYCETAMDVLAPRASEIAASHAASALGSTAGFAVLVVPGDVDPPLVVDVDEPVAEPVVPLDDAGEAVVFPDEPGGGSEATTTAVGVVAEGNVSTSPSLPELLPRKAKMTPTMPISVTTAMPATMGTMLFDVGLPAAGGGGGAAYAGPPIPPMPPCIGC